MKKITVALLVLAAILVGCASTSNVGDVPNRVEKNMTLPDGAKGDVLFSQKWSGEVGEYANDKTQWQGKRTVLNKVKTETELGYGSVWHNEDESEAISTLCTIMEESGFKYGVAYVKFDKRIRRYTFTYKKGKVCNGFMDFFDPSHEFYVAYNNKEAEKQKKREEKVAKVTNSILSPLTASSSTSNTATSEQQLYRLRHKTHEIAHIGKGAPLIFYWRYIYYDNGKQVLDYIVDLDGNIRSDTTPLDFNKSDFGKPIVPKYSVSKEIRDLAMKSLE